MLQPLVIFVNLDPGCLVDAPLLLIPNDFVNSVDRQGKLRSSQIFRAASQTNAVHDVDVLAFDHAARCSLTIFLAGAVAPISIRLVLMSQPGSGRVAIWQNSIVAEYDEVA